MQYKEYKNQANVCECDVVKDTGKEEYLRPFIHIGLDWITSRPHYYYYYYHMFVCSCVK